MASINLGLESLKPTQQGASESQLLVNYYAALNQFSDTVYEFKELCTTSESLRSIRSCIRQYGVTQSLESLFGENFSSAAAMEEEAAAAEQQIEAKKAGFFQRLIDGVKRIFYTFIAMVKQGWASIGRTKYAVPFKFEGELIDSADKFEAKKKEFKTKIAALNTNYKVVVKRLNTEVAKLKKGAKPNKVDVFLRDTEAFKDNVKTSRDQYNKLQNLIKCAKEATQKHIQEELQRKTT